VVFAGFMALGPSDWIAIAAIGAGALMGVLGKRVVAIIGGILLGLGLGGLAISLYQGDSVPPKLPPTNPLPPLPRTPPATTAERIYTDKTVDDMLGPCAGHTSLQCSNFVAPEVGKWLTTKGTVANIFPPAMLILIVGPKNQGVQCYFRDEWKPKLAGYSNSDGITVTGKIEQVQVGILVLSDCELP
jgi:hypothetical protein